MARILHYQGYVQFDVSTPDDFIDEVIETLESNDRIETEWGPNPTANPDDILSIQEVGEKE